MNGIEKGKTKNKKLTQITIVMAVIIKNGKVLLTQRFEEECPDAHLKWELPGGKIEFGEDPKDTIVREILEETGINVRVQKFISLVRTCIWEYEKEKQHTILLAYKCKFINQKKLKKKDHHILRFEWVKLDEVKKLELLPEDINFIKAGLI